MKRLLLLGPQEIQTGIWKTSKASGLLWEEGSNVVFRDQGFRRIDGALQQSVALADQARDIAQAYNAGQRRIYVGTDTTVEAHLLTAGVWTQIAIGNWPTAGSYADLETWGTWLVGTNNIDPVKVWKNSGPAWNNLAGTPFTRARIIKRKQPFLLAFNTNNIGDTGVEWSTDSNIELWTPGTSRAGNYVIRDLESEILAVEDLGDRLAVYSRSALVLGSFVGGENVWGWRRAISGIGAVSRRSVVTLDPYNYGLMREGIFKTDGNSFLWVDDPAMIRYIKDTADFSKEAFFWGIADSEQKSVMFSFLDIANAWHQVTYFPDRNYFTKSNFQLTAGAKKEVFGYPIVASEDLKVGTWGESSQHFGANIIWNLKTKPLDFGERSVGKMLQLVRVDGQWTSGSLRVQALQHPEDAAPVTVIDRALERENYFEFDAPYFTLEFYGTAPALVTGIEVFGLVTGVAL